MALLKILEYPDPRLRTRAEPVQAVDERIRRLVDDMLETMYAAPGIGLAATQVDVHERVLVLDVSDAHDQPLCLINPEILEARGSCQGEEGCLSVPEFTETVDRAEYVRVRALDREGQPFEVEAEGLLAVCVQHEMDHLEGKLFVDYVSELKRQRLRKKLTKSRKRDVPAGRSAEAAPAI
jgi:peptide deformylase